MNHLLSVIVPVYNVEKYLSRCIDSIINQTYTNLEIILVNDGSSDSSGDICDLYSERDKRVKVFHQINKGQSSARNVGLKNCKGDFIAFIDSDDWIELNLCEVVLSHVNKHLLDIVEFDINYTSVNNVSVQPKFIIENREESAIRILDNQLFSVCRRIYKKKLLENIVFNEDYIYEDMLFTSELLCKISKIGYYSKPLYNYYNENSSSTMRGNYTTKHLNSINVIFKFQELVFNCFKNIKIRSSARKYVLFFVMHHYQRLFENKKFDKDFVMRKKLKKMIEINYKSKDRNNTFTKVARYAPLQGFSLFLKLNKLR